MSVQFWRYSDLKSRGIVNNRMTLQRWIERLHFPQGFLLGPNTRVYSVEEVNDWLTLREEASQNKFLQKEEAST